MERNDATNQCTQATTTRDAWPGKATQRWGERAGARTPGQRSQDTRATTAPELAPLAGPVLSSQTSRLRMVVSTGAEFSTDRKHGPPAFDLTFTYSSDRELGSYPSIRTGEIERWGSVVSIRTKLSV